MADFLCNPALRYGLRWVYMVHAGRAYLHEGADMDGLHVAWKRIRHCGVQWRGTVYVLLSMALKPCNMRFYMMFCDAKDVMHPGPRSRTLFRTQKMWGQSELPQLRAAEASEDDHHISDDFVPLSAPQNAWFFFDTLWQQLLTYIAIM